MDLRLSVPDLPFKWSWAIHDITIIEVTGQCNSDLCPITPSGRAIIEVTGQRNSDLCPITPSGRAVDPVHALDQIVLTLFRGATGMFLGFTLCSQRPLSSGWPVVGVDPRSL